MDDSSKTPATKRGSVLSISHDKDVDGLIAAAIVWRYAKSKNMDYSVHLADYGSFESVFSKVSMRKKTLIIVTDLGMDDSSLDKVLGGLSRAISQGCRVVWLDHHPWSKHAVKEILSLPNKPILKINHDYCASEIAYKVLMPRDIISEELSVIAHDTDFNLRQIEAATALTDALSVIRFTAIDHKEDVTDALFTLLKVLAEEGIKGIWNEETKSFKDALLEKRVRHYRKEKMKKMRKALENHCDAELHGILIRILEMPNGITTTDLGTYVSDEENLKLEEKQLPIAGLLITLSPGGMLGFRRGSDRVLCNSVAAMFNGGGHPYAAGGEYGSYEDFQAVCDDILLTLSKNADWIAEPI
jgi:oligoribonuclease NrnB/cAMP/cGMP phosphodiesterase (DHH superfamily)